MALKELANYANSGSVTTSFIYLPHKKQFVASTGTNSKVINLDGTSFNPPVTNAYGWGYGNGQTYMNWYSGSAWSLYAADVNYNRAANPIHNWGTYLSSFYYDSVNDVIYAISGSYLCKLNATTLAVLTTYSFLGTIGGSYSAFALAENFDDFVVYNSVTGYISRGKLSTQTITSSVYQGTNVDYLAWDTARNIYRQRDNASPFTWRDYIPNTPVPTAVGAPFFDREVKQGGGANVMMMVKDAYGIGIPYQPVTLTLVGWDGTVETAPAGNLTVSPLSEASKIFQNLNISTQLTTSLNLVTDASGYIYFTYVAPTGGALPVTDRFKYSVVY